MLDSTKRLLSISVSCALLGFGIGAFIQYSSAWPMPEREEDFDMLDVEYAGKAGDARFIVPRQAKPPRGRRVSGRPRRLLVRDPVAGHVHAPLAVNRWDFAEHPAGEIVARTNNFGFRRDTNTGWVAKRGCYRILVTGDSHTDGYVMNRQNFCHLLETRLNAGRERARCEVLNGGVMMYGPHHYLAALQRHVQLRPNLFVIMFYVGNDFLNAADTGGLRGTVPRVARPPGYVARLSKVFKRPPVQQALMQAFLFTELPQLREPVMEESVTQIAEIQKLCKIEKIGLLVAVLPTKCDVEWPRDQRFAADRQDILERLQLKPEDLEVNRDMANTLIERLRGMGIECLDLLTAFAGTPGKLFWDQDHHLAPGGHVVVARALERRLADRVPQR